jgi:hypothetical protein
VRVAELPEVKIEKRGGITNDLWCQSPIEDDLLPT